jgi:thiol-disulfide isomerase/thioredoxin
MQEFDMTRWKKVHLLFLLCTLAISAYTQDGQSLSLNIGDPAPPLRVNSWLKGTPIKRFEKGRVYVIEFWATWCKPCIAAIPHLSALASKYREKVIFLGIDVYERKNNTSLRKVKAFVDSMGNQMDYNVAAEDSIFMETDWLYASGELGIPTSFIVNKEGKVVWIGHPRVRLDETLGKIVTDSFDMNEAMIKRNSSKYLAMLDDSLGRELIRYHDNPNKPGDLGQPDSALLAIAEIIKTEPKLKYAPLIASHRFNALLKTDPHKAYEYGKEILVTYLDDEPNYNSIIGGIEWYSDKLKLPPEIYLLGAEAYQVKINSIAEEEFVNLASTYYPKMAVYYWHANNKSKAINAQEKAIEILKRKKDFSTIDLATLESQLKRYKEM